MRKKDEKNGIEAVFPYLKEEWREMIKRMPKELLKNGSELRFRVGGSCSVTCGNGNYIVDEIDPCSKELNEVVEKICGGSLYQYEAQIENGYIPLPGGHRVGLGGTYVKDLNGVVRLRDIASVNFRICREISGNAEKLFPKLLCDGTFCSTMIVSEPCGGKTTLLSDLVRVLSNNGYRTVVIDERSEIAASYNGMPQKDLGQLTDVLNGYPKPYGMMVALRTLSPQVLVCDEIGTEEETERMLEAMNAGVPVLVSAHAKDEEELFNRPQIMRLMEYGALSKVVFLKGASCPGKVRKVITVNRYDDEDFWCSDDC